MSNTITNLMFDAKAAMDRVSREMVGFIPAVMRDTSLDRAVKGQTIRWPVAPASTASAITPGLYAPDTGDQTIGNDTMSLDQLYKVPFRWENQEVAQLNQGVGYSTVNQDQIAQAIRTLVNQIESDIADLSIYASRAADPNGTNLFDSTGKLSDAAEGLKILDENGAPMGDRQIVLGHDELFNLRGLTQLTNVNEAGGNDFLRKGLMGDLFNAAVRVSGQINAPTAGDAASSTTDNAGYAIGDTVLTLASAGTGEIKAGDVISIAGDASGSLYVVASGDADVSNGGTITLAAPGLKGTLSAATHAITVENVGATIRHNMVFDRSAIALAMRMPHMDDGGDAASFVFPVVDPISGLAFEIAKYPQYHRNYYEVRALWGVKAVKPAHMALLVD